MQNQTEVTVLRKKSNVNKTHVAHSVSEINAAKRSGAIVAVEKKISGTANTKTGDHRRIVSLDNNPDAVEPPKLRLDVGKAIQKRRQELGLNQKDLGTKINEKASVIHDYEMSKGIPNQQVLTKLERALGIKLRGNNIGEPFAKK